MNNFSLAVENDKPLEFMEALGFGGEMILIGMVAVFAVLGIIFALLTIFKFVFANTGKKEKAGKPKAETVATPAPVYTTSDTEIVAVIAAAIAMAEGESNSNVKFRVVSFKRK